MLTIRLQRVGRKNDPSFRVVVVESKRKPQTGNYLEMVGSYDARTDRVSLKEERIKHWLEHGATVSDTVHNILVDKKVIEGIKINVLPRKSPIKKDLPAQVGGGGEPQAGIQEAPQSEAQSIESEFGGRPPSEGGVSNEVAADAEAK